jgi:hypothetical protein
MNDSSEAPDFLSRGNVNYSLDRQKAASWIFSFNLDQSVFLGGWFQPFQLDLVTELL